MQKKSASMAILPESAKKKVMFSAASNSKEFKLGPKEIDSVNALLRQLSRKDL